MTLLNTADDVFFGTLAVDELYVGATKIWKLAPIVPVNTILPVITGTAQVGGTLVTTAGVWTGFPDSYAYQWKRNGTNISGATAASYLLVSADIGTTIAVVVTATTTAGSGNATATGVGPVTSIKAIDGTAGAQFSGGSSGTIMLSTTQTNDVVVLLFLHETNHGAARTIASVTSPHLTWTKRSNYAFTLDGCPVDLEIWWAPAAAVLTSEVITITLTGSTDDAAYHAFGVSGCANISAPWDTHASLAVARNSSTVAAGSVTVSGVSTASSAPMVIGFTGTHAGFTVVNPSGTTKIRADQNNSGGALWAFLGSFYQLNASAVSGASYTSTFGSTGRWGMVIDALV